MAKRKKTRASIAPVKICATIAPETFEMLEAMKVDYRNNRSYVVEEAVRLLHAERSRQKGAAEDPDGV